MQCSNRTGWDLSEGELTSFWLANLLVYFIKKSTEMVFQCLKSVSQRKLWTVHRFDFRCQSRYPSQDAAGVGRLKREPEKLSCLTCTKRIKRVIEREKNLSDPPVQRMPPESFLFDVFLLTKKKMDLSSSQRGSAAQPILFLKVY